MVLVAGTTWQYASRQLAMCSDATLAVRFQRRLARLHLHSPMSQLPNLKIQFQLLPRTNSAELQRNFEATTQIQSAEQFQDEDTA